ncbi:hypothetical protein KCV26_15405 [Petrimonas sulfuriphila]
MLTTEMYAVIRSDTDRLSMVYKIYEWLQTAAGKQGDWKEWIYSQLTEG